MFIYDEIIKKIPDDLNKSNYFVSNQNLDYKDIRLWLYD